MTVKRTVGTWPWRCRKWLVTTIKDDSKYCSSIPPRQHPSQGRHPCHPWFLGLFAGNREGRMLASMRLWLSYPISASGIADYILYNHEPLMVMFYLNMRHWLSYPIHEWGINDHILSQHEALTIISYSRMRHCWLYPIKSWGSDVFHLNLLPIGKYGFSQECFGGLFSFWSFYFCPQNGNSIQILPRKVPLFIFPKHCVIYTNHKTSSQTKLCWNIKKYTRDLSCTYNGNPLQRGPALLSMWEKIIHFTWQKIRGRGKINYGNEGNWCKSKLLPSLES